MRKKTAPKPRQHRPASPTQQSGLIAQGKDAQQSATRNCALDNRSHRTARASPAGELSAGGGMLKRAAMPASAQMNGFLSRVSARRVQALVRPQHTPLTYISH